MAEWLRRGLQILAPRFDSGRGLHRLLLYQSAIIIRSLSLVARCPDVARPENVWLGAQQRLRTVVSTVARRGLSVRNFTGKALFGTCFSIVAAAVAWVGLL